MQQTLFGSAVPFCSFLSQQRLHPHFILSYTVLFIPRSDGTAKPFSATHAVATLLVVLSIVLKTVASTRSKALPSTASTPSATSSLLLKSKSQPPSSSMTSTSALSSIEMIHLQTAAAADAREALASHLAVETKLLKALVEKTKAAAAAAANAPPPPPLPTSLSSSPSSSPVSSPPSSPAQKTLSHISSRSLEQGPLLRADGDVAERLVTIQLAKLVDNDGDDDDDDDNDDDENDFSHFVSAAVVDIDDDATGNDDASAPNDVSTFEAAVVVDADADADIGATDNNATGNDAHAIDEADDGDSGGVRVDVDEAADNAGV
jgi:hypothetical protein